MKNNKNIISDTIIIRKNVDNIKILFHFVFEHKKMVQKIIMIWG